MFDGINQFLKNSQRHELCFITEHEIYPILASWASTAYITTNFFSKYYLFQKVQNHVCYSCPVGSLCSLSGSESRDCWLRAQMCVFRWMAQMSPVIVITSRVQISFRKLFRFLNSHVAVSNRWKWDIYKFFFVHFWIKQIIILIFTHLFDFEYFCFNGYRRLTYRLGFFFHFSYYKNENFSWVLFRVEKIIYYLYFYIDNSQQKVWNRRLPIFWSITLLYCYNILYSNCSSRSSSRIYLAEIVRASYYKLHCKIIRYNINNASWALKFSTSWGFICHIASLRSKFGPWLRKERRPPPQPRSKPGTL